MLEGTFPNFSAYFSDNFQSTDRKSFRNFYQSSMPAVLRLFCDTQGIRSKSHAWNIPNKCNYNLNYSSYYSRNSSFSNVSIGVHPPFCQEPDLPPKKRPAPIFPLIFIYDRLLGRFHHIIHIWHNKFSITFRDLK